MRANEEDYEKRRKWPYDAERVTHKTEIDFTAEASTKKLASAVDDLVKKFMEGRA